MRLREKKDPTSLEWEGWSNAQKRAWLAGHFLNEARGLLHLVHQPHTIVGFTNGRAVRVKLPRPSTTMIKDLMISAAVAVDKSLVLERHDSGDQGLSAVDRWLAELIQGPTKVT